MRQEEEKEDNNKREAAAADISFVGRFHKYFSLIFAIFFVFSKRRQRERPTGKKTGITWNRFLRPTTTIAFNVGENEQGREREREIYVIE